MGTKNNHQKINITHRLATLDDEAEIIALMQASIEHNMKPFLTPEEIIAAKESMGVDHTLLADNTYFVIETVKNDKTIMIGCGGWGKRKTLYGGDHTAGRDDSLSDPATDPARIRAMYTHPNWTRLGVGSLLLDLGESAAREAGFKTIELGSTVPGEPLYIAKGYKEIYREQLITENGSESLIIKMTKNL